MVRGPLSRAEREVPTAVLGIPCEQIGIPIDGDDQTVSGLKSDIASARGKMAIIEGGD